MPDRKYAAGGIVRAPGDDDVISTWFISNVGATWFVISCGRSVRIVDEPMLDRWQAMALGSKVEPVEDDLSEEAVAMVGSTCTAPGILSRAASLVSPVIWVELVLLAAVAALYLVLVHVVST